MASEHIKVGALIGQAVGAMLDRGMREFELTVPAGELKKYGKGHKVAVKAQFVFEDDGVMQVSAFVTQVKE